MSAWEIIVFVLVIVVLGASIWFLNRSEKRTKNRWKLNAYKLLEEKNPDPKKILETVKFIRIYGGHISRDPEFVQLDKLLCDLYRELNKAGKVEPEPKKTKK